MSKGGARARSGPTPDPTALRRDRQDDAGKWVTLPSEGRQGEVPEWPLSKANERELAIWDHEWSRPQAVEWERNGQEIEVAMYVRTLADAERRDARTNARTLVRQQQEALGLSLPGLLRNRWKIEAGENLSREPAVAAGPAARDRFKVLAGGKQA